MAAKRVATKKPAQAMAPMKTIQKNKLPWYTVFVGSNNPGYMKYMQTEWGFEKRGDQALFEKVCLEGQQAGLSWATVLAKRQAYRRAFHNFHIGKCAAMTSKDIDKVMSDARKGPGGSAAVILHRGKLLSIVSNAKAALRLKQEPYVDPNTQEVHKSLDGMLWSFVNGRPQLNNWKVFKEMPTATPTAQAMSKALKKKGFNFCGPTICYSIMQSCGLVVDHLAGSPEWRAAKARLKARA
mmetsp:Transcript_275/g.928  ORF Transcript_275/g.928 Transcript_275/m.928 type:complete len:239 (+) Transcript_275:35-751(+)